MADTRTDNAPDARPAAAEARYVAGEDRTVAPCLRAPNGCLPVPEAVREQVDRDAAELKARHGYDLTSAGRQRLTNDYLVQFYGNGRPVVCERTDRGLVLWAVGADQVEAFLTQSPAWPGRNLSVEVAPPW